MMPANVLSQFTNHARGRDHTHGTLARRGIFVRPAGRQQQEAEAHQNYVDGDTSSCHDSRLTLEVRGDAEHDAGQIG